MLSRFFSQVAPAVRTSMTAISRLRFRGCPDAVARLVVAVVINPLQGHAFRSLTHVSEEVLERVPPSLADGDAPAAVPMISSGIRVEAPLFHGAPDVVGARLAHAVPDSRRRDLPATFRAQGVPRRRLAQRFAGLLGVPPAGAPWFALSAGLLGVLPAGASRLAFKASWHVVNPTMFAEVA